MMNVRLKEMPDRVAELQLHHTYFYTRKHKSHAIYKVARLFSSETGTKRNVVYDLVQSLLRSEKLKVGVRDGGGGGGGRDGGEEVMEASQLAKSLGKLYEEQRGRAGGCSREEFALKLKEAVGIFEKEI
jgi:hypothetical protein